MTFDTFLVKYTNKYVDWDGYYGAQCMDLYRKYVNDVIGTPQSPPVSGAAKVWDTYRKDVFDRISNGPVNAPARGDIIIWNNKAGGGYGHIAICIDAKAMTFNSFDQNWPTGSTCHKQPHNYTNVLGWLTKKKEDSKIDSIGQAPAETNIPPTETPPQPQTTPETLPTATEGTTGSETPSTTISNDAGDFRPVGVDSTASEPVEPASPLDVGDSPPIVVNRAVFTPPKGLQVDIQGFVASIVSLILKVLDWLRRSVR